MQHVSSQVKRQSHIKVSERETSSVQATLILARGTLSIVLCRVFSYHIVHQAQWQVQSAKSTVVYLSDKKTKLVRMSL